MTIIHADSQGRAGSAFMSRRQAANIGTPMLQQLVTPMLAHVLLTVFLYVLLTIARAPAIWGIGRRPDGSNPFAAFEPRISANLSNQFEWPMLFYVACMLLHLLGAIGQETVALAWVFVVGRFLHTCVQVCTTNVRLRGAVFTANFLAVLGMWVFVSWAAAIAD